MEKKIEDRRNKMYEILMINEGHTINYRHFESWGRGVKANRYKEKRWIENQNKTCRDGGGGVWSTISKKTCK